MEALEALRKIVDRLAIKKYNDKGELIYWQSTTDEEYQIIEVALKENEILVGEITYLKNRYKSCFKALDLILRKNVFLPTVIFCQTVDYYNQYHSPELTQEEFDFLKETIHGMYDSSK